MMQMVERIAVQPFRDSRGSLNKLFEKGSSSILGIEIADLYVSRSFRNVVRGLHFQAGEYAQDKYIFCISGRIIDVAVSLNPDSFGHIVLTEIDSSSNFILRIPGSFAHGIISLEEDTTFLNFSPNPYRPGNEKGILWSSIGYNFSLQSPIVSEKDRSLPTLEQMQKELI